jgi:hypothetical protein
VQLSTEEQQILQSGKPVRCVESETRLECVVLRADQFERLGYHFDSDGSAPVSEMHSLLAEFSPEDWKDPAEWKADSPT